VLIASQRPPSIGFWSTAVNIRAKLQDIIKRPGFGASAIVALLLLTCWPTTLAAQAPDVTSSALVLAPVGRQAGWLSLVAPRPRLLTHLDAPDYVSDVSVAPDSSRAAVVVIRTPAVSSVAYGDLMVLDLASSTLSPLVGSPGPSESLGAPVWSADGSRLLYQREDVGVVGTSYAGGATVQYPSRIEQVSADGSARTVLVEDGRQPATSPDGQSIAYVRRLQNGPTLVIRSLLDGTERVLLGPGQFGDIVSPGYSPQGDRIAFMAPVGQSAPLAEAFIRFFDRARFGAPIRLAHGVPWDLWIVKADGSAAASRLAGVSADDGSVTWSPDGSRLFVYGGTGSFLVDSATGETSPLSFLAGYGGTSWVSD
jgi:Tol biopolymer transport system component